VTSISNAPENAGGAIAAEPQADRPVSAARRGQRRILTYAVTAAGGCAAALAFGLWLGGIWPQSQLALVLNTDAVTAWGLPVSRLSVDLCAVGTAGMLITCILLPRVDGALSDAARHCLRSAIWLALAWSGAALAMLLFSWSDVTGVSVSQLPFAEIFGGADTSYPEATSYLFAALLAAIIGAAAAVTESRRGAAILLLLTGYNLLPLTTAGHASHSRIVGLAVTVHVVALALWIGGLAGLLVHVRRSPALLAVAVPRFSRLALACFVAVGASGITVAWLNLDALPELWGSRYGLLVLWKATALASLGIFGWWHRRRTVRAVAGQRDRHAFLRLAAVEVVVMVATVALGVALSRTPTPATTKMQPHAASFQQTQSPAFLRNGRPASAKINGQSLSLRIGPQPKEH
jgi:putative copper resistance protein D